MKLLDATPISIDYRGEALTAAYLALVLPEACTPNAHLLNGDLAWDTEQASYGVELKSITDTLGSLGSKEHGERLEKQLDGLRHAVNTPILGIHGLYWVVEGKIVAAGPAKLVSKRWEDRQEIVAPIVTHSGWSVESLEGFLWSVANPDDGRGVQVVWRPTRELLLDAIVELYWWSRKREHGTFTRSLDTSSVGRSRHPGENGLAKFIGSQDKAAKLLEVFGRVADVLAADDKELLSVKGVGPEAVKKLREALNEVRG